MIIYVFFNNIIVFVIIRFLSSVDHRPQTAARDCVRGGRSLSNTWRSKLLDRPREIESSPSELTWQMAAAVGLEIVHSPQSDQVDDLIGRPRPI
jgi:hypothetical protein